MRAQWATNTWISLGMCDTTAKLIPSQRSPMNAATCASHIRYRGSIDLCRGPDLLLCHENAYVTFRVSSFFFSIFLLFYTQVLLGRARKDAQRYPKQYIFLPRISVYTHRSSDFLGPGTGLFGLGSPFFVDFIACARRLKVLQSDCPDD